MYSIPLIRQLLITVYIILSLLPLQSFCQTTSINKKAKAIIAELKKNSDYPFGGKDTLIDLNKDGYRDILIEFYSGSGTGLKNGISVYLYDHSKNKFNPCEQLNNLANPTFYFKEKIVVGYYIAIGGGYASKFKWNGLRFDSLEKIDIDVVSQNNKPLFKLASYNFVTKRKTYKTLTAMQLPKEYKYFNYLPLIK